MSKEETETKTKIVADIKAEAEIMNKTEIESTIRNDMPIMIGSNIKRIRLKLGM